MQRSNFDERELHQHQRRHGHNWVSSKQKRKNQSLSMTLEEENGEDLVIFKGEIKHTSHGYDGSCNTHLSHLFHPRFLKLFVS